MARIIIRVLILFTPFSISAQIELFHAHNCSDKVIAMKTFSGLNTQSYPVAVFNVNGNYLDTANNQTQYISIWNSDSANQSQGLLKAGLTEFLFLIKCSSPIDKVIGDQIMVQVSVRAIIQGAWRPSLGKMGIELNSNNVLPLSQPYNIWPFDYYAVETVQSIPANVVDWVLVELRDPANLSTLIAKKAAFIKDNGDVVDLDGVSPVRFMNIEPGSYYVVLRHRNHLGIATALPLALSIPSVTYDFTTAQSQAWQKPGITQNAAQVEVSTGVFALWGGDYNHNTSVRYSGSANDNAVLLSGTLSGDQNAVLFPVYNFADGNLNAEVKYLGTDNDNNFLLYTVLGGNVTALRYQHLLPF